MSGQIYTNDIDDETVEILKEDEDVVKCYFEEACQETYKKAHDQNSIQHLSNINDLIGITNKKKWGKVNINDTVKIIGQLLCETNDKYLFELSNTNGIFCNEKEKLNLPHRCLGINTETGFRKIYAEPINKCDTTFYINLKCSAYGKPEYYEHYGKIILVIQKATNTNNEWYNNNFMKNITLYLQE